MKPFRMTVFKICPHIQEVTRFLVILHPISTCCYLTIPETFIEYFSKVGFTAPWLKGLNFLIVKQNLENILKGGYPIIFASNVFHNSHLIQKCIQNQQQLMILYTFLKQMRVVKNIRRKVDRINSL